jgi:predicted Zn-dependent protease
MKQFRVALSFLTLGAVFFIVSSCAVNPVTGKKQLMFMSESQEVAMGAQYDPQVVATFGEYNNDKLEAFVQNQGNEMGKISHRPKLQYHIKLLDSPVVNAFAVPGGYIYLTRGILAQFNNEAELAGVIGHEMGHVTARHSVSQQAKQQVGTLLVIGGMIASEKVRQMADYAMGGMQLLFLKFSRDNEREADRLGVEYSSKIGYDAHKMADFFNVLNKMNMAESEGGVPTFMSTHPDPGDRNVSVNQMAAEWQNNLKFPSWKVNSDSYLQMIDGIVYGEDPRQGYVEGNTFYHPDMKFKFSFPAGWKLENTPAQVNMVPPDGKALMIFALAGLKTAAEAAPETLKNLNLTMVESKRTTVNGLPAIATVSTQVSQDQTQTQQPALRVLSYFIEYNGSCFVFHGVTAEPDFRTYAPIFEPSMANFSKLTDATKLNVKPDRIFVKKVQRAGTASEAFNALGVPANKLEDIALLNNLELTDRLAAGKMVKIVGK